MDKTNTIQFRVSDSMKARIDAFAAEHDMNTSEACRNLISMELNRKETVFAASEFVEFLKQVGFTSLDEIEPKALDDAAKFYQSYREGIRKDPTYWMALGKNVLNTINQGEKDKAVKGSYAARCRHILQGDRR